MNIQEMYKYTSTNSKNQKRSSYCSLLKNSVLNNLQIKQCLQCKNKKLFQSKFDYKRVLQV